MSRLYNAIVIDTEATGINPEVDQVIEVAFQKLHAHLPAFYSHGGNYSEYTHELFMPSVPMNLGAQATHNILMSELRGKPHPSTFKFPEGVDFAIGHNIDFDLEMLGVMGKVKGICTLALSRFLWPEIDSHKQSAMMYHYARQSDDPDASEIAVRSMIKDAHSALCDIWNCRTLLQNLMVTAHNRGYTLLDWNDVYALSEKARIPTVMQFGKHQGCLIEHVPRSYVQWYMREAKQDPYLVKAFKKAGLA